MLKKRVMCVAEGTGAQTNEFIRRLPVFSLIGAVMEDMVPNPMT